MKKNKTILVAYGGNSSEREVSLKSGKACIKAIKGLKYKVIDFDPAKNHLSAIKNYKVDLIFNALHGKDGEDGIAQSYFEYYKIPYTHSGIISSMNAMDKIISKKIFKKINIKTPDYITFNSIDYYKSLKEKIIINSNLIYPLVVKPSNEGSSIGVKICKNFVELKKSIVELFKEHKTLIVENFIGGQEIQVAVINGKALGAIELKPKRKFYDYEAKYNPKAKTQHIIPVELNSKNLKKITNIALKAHKVIGCRSVTRSDFKFYKGKFYLLEINTQPGMTKLSLVPEIADYIGISFIELIEWILKDASINR